MTAFLVHMVIIVNQVKTKKIAPKVTIARKGLNIQLNTPVQKVSLLAL
jgi:hypothetical protein